MRKKNNLKKTLVFVTTLTLLTTILFSISVNVSAEEPPEPPNEGWFVEGNGTYFEITHSNYLNITLSSSENIYIYLESIPNSICYYIESNCSANSTLITLTGFEINDTYYQYQDGILISNFTIDETGSYSYTQDLENCHNVLIQNYTSTLVINADGTISPPSANIQYVGNNKYVLTGNIIGYDEFWILKSNIVLDGQGYTYKIISWGRGIFINNVQNVTVQNFGLIHSYSHQAVFPYRSPYVTIRDCTISTQTGTGIWADSSHILTITNVTVSGTSANSNTGVHLQRCYYCTLRDSTISNFRDGVYTYQAHYLEISNSKIIHNQNRMAEGLTLMGCMDSKIINNTISGYSITNSRGVYIYGAGNYNITRNIISNNYYGMYFHNSWAHIITANTISNNLWGIYLYYYPTYVCTFYHNNIIDNTNQVYVYALTSHIWDNGAGEGNYWSDYTGADDGSNDRIAGDGIGDTLIPHPYTNQGNGYYHLDNYPLMNPWGLNDPPVANADGPYEVNEGTEITFNASASSDPDGDELHYRWDFDNDGVWDTSYSTDPTASYTWDDDYTGNITVEVYDGDLTDTSTATVTVNNAAPIADAGVDHTGDEPSTFIFTGSHTDPGTLDTHTYEWDFNYDGIIFDVDSTGDNIQNTWEDDFNGTVALRVTDDDGGWHIDTCNVKVNNVAPTITSLCLPIDPLAKNTPVDLTATFADPGILDTHIAIVNWGDGNTTNGTISGSGGTYTLNIESWTYGQPGVYTITLTVEDDDGGKDTMIFKYVVIYDPSAGFVTGGGWIMSPEGAYTQDPTLTGKANFGFVAKYKKGQSTPDGNTEFQFKVANLNFHSNDYDWLIIQIAGAKAMYMGTGTINGEGNYGFKLTAIDEELTPSTDVDMFRIKIWDKDNNDEIIYDNQLGDEDDCDPSTPISGGNIRIHEG